jgi:hypothetical protein
MEDADQPVGERAQRFVVGLAASSELVVVAAAAGGSAES